MKEDSANYAFVIIVLELPPEALILAGKNGTHFFFTKSWSKNNFKLKNQFQQANPTGAQNLTLCPLLIYKEAESRPDKIESTSNNV